MNDFDKEYLSFISAQETPPPAVAEAARKEILLSFQSKSILWRFLAFQILGAAFSLSICPQFGIGLVEGHGITHVFRMIGDWACALFCGSLFLSSGMLIALIGMKGEELWWIWRRYHFTSIILPAFLWAGLMMANIALDLSGEKISYHLIWIISAVMAQALWFKFRSALFDQSLKT
jgi:hypothetical protein